MSIQQGDDMDAEIVAINVTPLVDVVLVLLIIFMVTASFIIKETVEVDLPKAANAGETVQGLISIVIDNEGKFFLDGTEVNEAALKQHVRDSVLKDKESRAIVSADQALSYGRVMHVIDLIKGEGIAKFALNIQKEASAVSE
ncbi:MAG: biopolymer transporter ExbD [Proteobacteria bacterium]|nr:biopolymer transporter ExbD [Cystobacterineae bacterium]MCL2259464.1 biopolymer transporter ExbD [Cystobacterineae bacterium]MCL2314075.1 biopolymer transporter ExbD [Pseudomonadota bacterium]